MKNNYKVLLYSIQQNNNKKSHSTYLCICADCVEMIHDGKDRGLGRVSNVEMGVKALKYRGGRLKEVGGKGEIGLKSPYLIF